ncbi:MAG TPA: hypothetical protein PKA69_12400, partial [Lacibacter sp.]|nr:hypothetical protein [Lacibacter sp.]
MVLGALADKAKKYYDMVLGSMEMKVNLLVLNPDDWKKFTTPQIMCGMPHWRRTDNALIVASDEPSFGELIYLILHYCSRSIL